MKAGIRKIGPSEAEQLLAANHHNRPVKAPHISRLATDMRNGDWRHGSSILIAADEQLLDGQHRLQAIIASGTTQEFVVITGLAAEDQEAVDTGMKRTTADMLALRGEANSVPLAAALLWLWKFQKDKIRSNQRPSAALLMKVLEYNPEIRESINLTRRARNRLKMPSGICIAVHYQQCAIDPDDTAAFWEMLATGLFPPDSKEMPQADHPVRRLQEKLQANAVAARGRLDYITIAALMIKAWNAYRAGTPVALLKFTRGGAKPEPFPEMK